MSTTVIGGLTNLGVATYTEQPGAELDIDDYGLDTLTRSYGVRADSIAVFLAAFPKGQVDATFNWLYIVSVRISDVRGPYPQATVTFKGATLETLNQNPKLPRKEMVTGGLAQQQVSLQALSGNDDEEVGTKDVTYRAPWTEWRYITTTDPKTLGPAHAGKLNVQNPVATVIYTRGALGELKIFNDFIVPPGTQPPPPNGTPFVGLLKVVPSKFDYTQVGKVFQVIERNELIVIDYIMFVLNNQTGW